MRLTLTLVLVCLSSLAAGPSTEPAAPDHLELTSKTAFRLCDPHLDPVLDLSYFSYYGVQLGEDMDEIITRTKHRFQTDESAVTNDPNSRGFFCFRSTALGYNTITGEYDPKTRRVTRISICSAMTISDLESPIMHALDIHSADALRKAFGDPESVDKGDFPRWYRYPSRHIEVQLNSDADQTRFWVSQIAYYE